MDVTVTAALIGGACTIIAGTCGALLGKAQAGSLFGRKGPPAFLGTTWESRWRPEDGEVEHLEVFSFDRQVGHRVYGVITSKEFPDMRWDLEGDYNDRFLRLFWTPSKDAPNRFFLDHGCYFFERRGDGSFSGYAVGFDSDDNQVSVCRHSPRRVGV